MSFRRGQVPLAVLLTACCAPSVAGDRAESEEPGQEPGTLDRQVGQFASPGALALAHAELGGISQCDRCHGLLEGTPDALCLDCHEPVRELLATRQGVHGSFEGACAGCHSDHHGRDHDLLGLDREAFNHDRARFVLRGAHAGTACDDCHLQRDPETEAVAFHAFGIPHDACARCHEDPHGETLVRSRDCGECHEDSGWTSRHLVPPGQQGGFDHDADTRFALDATHQLLACGTCHLEGRKEEGRKKTPTDCAGCHADAVALLAGRFESIQRAPDPHRETTSCADCHPPERKADDLTSYGDACASCHPAPYTLLLTSQRAILDEAIVAAETQLRELELAARSEGRSPTVSFNHTRAWLARLARSGMHNPELAETLARSLDRNAASPR